MAHPQQPPQLAQPPFHPQQAPPKKTHTVRTVLLVIGSVFVVLIGIGIASGGGDTPGPAAGNPGTADPATTNPATKAPKTGAPKPTASAEASVAPPVAKVACADQDDRAAPCTVTVGATFALGKHQVLAGWKISDSGYGMKLTGKAKNISDDADSSMLITVKFLRGDEVMANIMCTTGALAAGQVETMSCLPDGTYTKKFDKVTAEAAF